MDLRTTYMGMELTHPLVASSSPLSGSVANIKRLEDAGAAAVVMFSLFEEQLQHESAALEYLMTAGTESFAESLNYFPEVEDYTVGPDSYLVASEACQLPVRIMGQPLPAGMVGARRFSVSAGKPACRGSQ